MSKAENLVTVIDPRGRKFELPFRNATDCVQQLGWKYDRAESPKETNAKAPRQIKAGTQKLQDARNAKRSPNENPAIPNSKARAVDAKPGDGQPKRGRGRPKKTETAAPVEEPVVAEESESLVEITPESFDETPFDLQFEEDEFVDDDLDSLEEEESLRGNVSEE